MDRCYNTKLQGWPGEKIALNFRRFGTSEEYSKNRTFKTFISFWPQPTNHCNFNLFHIFINNFIIIATYFQFQRSGPKYVLASLVWAVKQKKEVDVFIIIGTCLQFQGLVGKVAELRSKLLVPNFR